MCFRELVLSCCSLGSESGTQTWKKKEFDNRGAFNGCRADVMHGYQHLIWHNIACFFFFDRFGRRRTSLVRWWTEKQEGKKQAAFFVSVLFFFFFYYHFPSPPWRTFQVYSSPLFLFYCFVNLRSRFVFEWMRKRQKPSCSSSVCACVCVFPVLLLIRFVFEEVDKKKTTLFFPYIYIYNC